MQEPSWDDIRIFLSVAEAGSLSAAAETLGLSQPTVGRRLKALEDGLRVRLIERVSNRIELTRAGQQILERALGMTGIADGILREANAIARQEPEAIRISSTASISLFLASQFGELSAFADHMPLVIEASRERMNLARREADIAIRMSRLPDEGDLVARKVARFAFTLYGVRGSDPATAPIIGLQEGSQSPTHASFLESWARDRVVLARLSEISLRHRAMKSAKGIALLPCWLGDSDPDLERLVPPPQELQEDVYLLMRRDSKQRKAINLVLGGLTQLFKHHSVALAGEV